MKLEGVSLSKVVVGKNRSYGGHFGFLPTTTYAHTFERDTPPVSFNDVQRRQKH